MEKPKNTPQRLVTALVAYAVLIAAASLSLQGLALKFVLILFAGLIARTVIAWKAGW